MTEPDRSRSSPNALEALDRSISALSGRPLTRVGGVITAVTPGYYRVSGLSKFVKLGECVELSSSVQSQRGEVVRIDETGATIKTFEPVTDAGLGTLVWRQGPVMISPDMTWKGRILNALGQPIDGAGPMLTGERAVSTEREPPRRCAASR
ncbi:MAG: flagellum-specific ATP synthase FliI, partial [Rhodomicrobium sp.]|nr:flagellum-specific ATP synthase FliI [Rhodomicrobium sp.]